MNISKTGLAATIIGSVALVGAAAWGATALTTDEPETAYTGAYEPAITETPTVDPTLEVTETPMAEASAEDQFLDEARVYPKMDGFEMSDEELLAAGLQACEYIAELGTTNLGHDIRVIPSESMGIRNMFTEVADEYLCD